MVVMKEMPNAKCGEGDESRGGGGEGGGGGDKPDYEALGAEQRKQLSAVPLVLL